MAQITSETGAVKTENGQDVEMAGAEAGKETVEVSDANKELIEKMSAEKTAVDDVYPIAAHLLSKEIDKLTKKINEPAVLDMDARVIKIERRIRIPIEKDENFNFVGRLIGSKGMGLKHLQKLTNTRIAVLGKGSIRDKEKELELLNSGDPKYAHLADDLHVRIEVNGPPYEVYHRLAHAISEVTPYLDPKLDLKKMEESRSMMGPGYGYDGGFGAGRDPYYGGAIGDVYSGFEQKRNERGGGGGMGFSGGYGGPMRGGGASWMMKGRGSAGRPY